MQIAKKLKYVEWHIILMKLKTNLLSNIYTKSSIPYDSNSGDYESKWILNVKSDCKQTIVIILFDFSTLQFNIG